KKQINFETWGSPWVDDDNNREIIIARMLAKKYNLNHRVISKTIVKNVTEFSGGWFDWRRVKLGEKRRFSGLGGGFIGDSASHSPPIPLDKKTSIDIEETLQNMFSDNFRNKISSPFASLQNELNNIKADNGEMLFQFFIYMRGIFTNIFGGTRAGYHDPYSFLTRENSIFYDIDLLKVLLTIPVEYFADRKLYVTMYNNHFSELLNIPTTRPDLNPIQEGENPHHHRKRPYGKALTEHLESNEIWERDFYNKEYIESISDKEKHPVLMAFIDFETWYKKCVI
ncbi:MAG: hypothetical protein KAG99_10365, partial [Bacteroidales bacterium]|nr:hypothetical protein [Bacteroidales bacterium]